MFGLLERFTSAPSTTLGWGLYPHLTFTDDKTWTVKLTERDRRRKHPITPTPVRVRNTWGFTLVIGKGGESFPSG